MVNSLVESALRDRQHEEKVIRVEVQIISYLNFALELRHISRSANVTLL